MTELYDEEGNAIEAFTQKDMDARIEEITAGHDEKVSELTEKLEKEEAKEKNFAKLREQKKEVSEEDKKKEEKNATTIEDLKTQIEDAKGAGISKVLEMQRSAVINELANGDEELAKKIEANYKLINKPEETAEEIAIRANDALLISMDIGPDDIAGGDVIPPSGPGRAVGGSNDEISSDLKDIGKKFGVSDADWKKHG